MITGTGKTTGRTLKRRAIRLEDYEPTNEKRTEIIMPAQSAQVRNSMPAVTHNMKILHAKNNMENEDITYAKRVPYASMRAHMETAAVVLAAGGTQKMAAAKAGVHPRQIKKYNANPDFRQRVAELQETLVNKILGKVVTEIDRRTNPEIIAKMELLDLLRVGDRVGLGRGSGNTIVNDTSQTNYEATFNQLILSEPDKKRVLNAGEENLDFPEFESTSLALSGGDSPIDG